MSEYTLLSNFGRNVYNISENPLNHCLLSPLDSAFINGSGSNRVSGMNSHHCQAFMSDYCANNWNNTCEILSESTQQNTVNSLSIYSLDMLNPLKNHNNELTSGDILLLNVAYKKYLKNGSCNIKHEPFDSMVVNSPLISLWDKHCIPVFEVDPKIIDEDPVMNKLLLKPLVGLNILVNIYNTAIRKNTIDSLRGTKLYTFFYSKNFQDYINRRC